MVRLSNHSALPVPMLRQVTESERQARWSFFYLREQLGGGCREGGGGMPIFSADLARPFLLKSV